MVLPQAMAWVHYWFCVLSLKFCGKSKKIAGIYPSYPPLFACMYPSDWSGWLLWANRQDAQIGRPFDFKFKFVHLRRSSSRSGSRFCVSDWFRWWALASSLIGKTKHKFGYTNTQKAEQIQKVFKCPHILKSTKTNILRDWSQWLVSANRPLSDWPAYKQQRRVKFQMNYLLHVWAGFKWNEKYNFLSLIILLPKVKQVTVCPQFK